MSKSLFDTSSYLKSEKNNAPFSLGTNKPLFNYSEFMKKSEEKSDKIEDDKEEKTKNLLGHYKDYLEATKKSEEDKDRDLVRELASKNNLSTRFAGGGESGFATEVAQGLNMFQPTINAKQMFIPSEDPKGKSLGQRFAGGFAGLGQGLLTGVPHGGAFGFASGFLG